MFDLEKKKAMDIELFDSDYNRGHFQSSHTYWTDPLLCLRLSLDRLLLAALIGAAAGEGGAVPVLLKVRSLHVIVIGKLSNCGGASKPFFRKKDNNTVALILQ